jgi:hypothetical protein
MRVNAEAVQKASAAETVLRDMRLIIASTGRADSERISSFAREIRLGCPVPDWLIALVGSLRHWSITSSYKIKSFFSICLKFVNRTKNIQRHI